MIRVDMLDDLSSRKLKNKAVWVTGLLLVLLASSFVDPERVTVLSCVFHNMTGYSCPTCGISRSLHAMSHFRLLESFRFHWMGPVLYFSALILSLKFILEITMRREIIIKVNPIMMKMALIGISCIWIAFCVFRLIHEVNL